MVARYAKSFQQKRVRHHAYFSRKCVASSLHPRFSAASVCHTLALAATSLLARPFIRIMPHQPKTQYRNAADASYLPGNASDLASYLLRHGMDSETLAQYGKDKAKSLNCLLEEVQQGETMLVVQNGRVLRQVEVLNVYICNDAGQCLMEEKQVLPDGRLRQRGLPLSEKLVRGEDWRSALVRAVREELGSVLPNSPQITILEDTYYMDMEQSVSNSYPGLLSEYHIHRVQAHVQGLPTTERFVTTEPRAGGVLTNHWQWVSRTDPPFAHRPTKSLA